MTRKTNILLVDDKPERLLTYEVILDRLDQNLVRATSGEEAYARLKEAEFAAILLDVSMPGMDGFETAALIRNDPEVGPTPIIFVTGVHLSDEDQLRGYEMGAADYVNVPVVPEILRSKISVLVELYLQRRELADLNERLAAMNEELAEAHARSQAENVRELQRLNRILARANENLVSEVAERERAEAMLIEAARRKDEFISVLGHELRNPLAAMQSGVDLLDTDAAAENRITWTRELLQRQLRHLKRLIDELLDVSRIKTGRVQLQREALDLKQVISHSLDATRALVDEHGHSLVVEEPPEPLHVDGDSLRLTQVFCNLLSNAAKFTEPGGTIRLTMEKGANSPGSAIVRVKDDGAGIEPNMLENVFELFTQANIGGARNRSGLGIGLALVRSLVELHGGTVRATSDGLGHGAEFIVALPLAERPVARLPEPAPRIAPNLDAPLRLLLIDDNSDMTTGFAMYFANRHDFEVRVANNGRDGIEAAMEFKPQAVLLDIGLPDLDGYEVAQELRRHVEFKSIPLIAISGFSSEADRKRARKAGFDRFVVKPVQLDSLHDLVLEAVEPRPGRAVS
jgi:signal transduction histidine kinase